MTGSSFLDRDALMEPDWWTGVEDEDESDYIPTRERRTQTLLADLAEIPTDQWEEELDSEDYALVKPYIPDVRRQERRLNKLARKARARRR
jgi:hypothetical protein